MSSRKYDAACFFCDFWWLILLLISVLLATFFTRNLWGPLLFPDWRLPVVEVEAPEFLGNGDVQITLSWEGTNDLDLYVVDPLGEEIYHSHDQSISGGTLDVDANEMCLSVMNHPVENVFWPANSLIQGEFDVFVHYFKNCGDPVETPFTVAVMIDGQSQTVQGQFSAEDEMLPVLTFTR